MVSNKLNGFLESFQTGTQMIPFMTDAPDDIQDFFDRIILYLEKLTQSTS